MAIDFNSLYQQNLGREADAGGLAYWQGLSKSGMSDADLKNSFFSQASKEMQKSDTGLSAETDAWDEKRIAGAMQLYDSNPVLAKQGYFASAGDTGTTSAADRLGGFNINKPISQQQATTPAPAQNLGMTPQVDTSYKKNPYLDEMAAGITSQMNDNWTRNQLPSMRSGAMAAGGFGGSRQGVVEANGLNDMNRSLSQNLANLYGTDYTNAQNRNLQQQSINNSYSLGQGNLALGQQQANNSYDLGLRSSDLGFAGLDANIAQNNFGNNLASANFGMGVYNTLNSNNGTAVNAGTAIQNTPLDYQKYFTNSASGVGSGFGSTTSSQTLAGNPYATAIGGAMMGNSIQYPKVGY